MRYVIAIALAGALALSACDDDEGLVDDGGDGAAAVEVGPDGGTAPRPAGPHGAEDDPEDDGAVESVRAGDAGEVDVRVIDGRRLELVEVREAAGWSHEVGEDSGDDVEIGFRHEDGRALELEIELEDGGLRADVD